MLTFTNRKAADAISKVLESAVANAEHNYALDAEELFVAEAFADEGPTLKRYRPRARGRASRIRKRTSHITIVVGDEDEEAALMGQKIHPYRASGSASLPTGSQVVQREGLRIPGQSGPEDP